VIDSAFWFRGRLLPSAATRFNVQGISVAPGVEFVALHDGIAVWSKPGSSEMKTLEAARDFLDIVVSAHALISGIALDFSFEGWVEAKAALVEDTVIGFGVDPRGHDPYLAPRSRRSVDMRRAARLAAAARGAPGWRLALRDVWSALSLRGDDAFVFAYRAVEDLARAVSGRAGELRASDWRTLHAHLSTYEDAFRARIGPLQDARRAAAHGDESDPKLQAARQDRAARLAIGRRIVADAIVAEPALPLEGAWVRP
jgi:hypothetical protein